MSGIVQFSELGSFGRFGNQLFQYAFARAYAEKQGAVLETPPWVGQKLFGLTDPPLSRELPCLEKDVIPNGEVDVDLFGHFQFQAALDLYSRQQVRRWFHFTDRWRGLFPERSGEARVVAHLRRGDYADSDDTFCLVSEESYLRACRRFGLDESRIVWLQEGAPNPPFLAAEGLGFLPDFFTMIRAGVLLRANSTFSWWAAVLGGAEVYSPVVGDRVGLYTVEFVRGNYPGMFRGATDLHLREV